MFAADGPQHEVWVELKSVCRRGVRRLDELDRPGVEPVATPLLDAAASAFPGATRSVRVRNLLTASVARVRDASHRDQVTTLLGLHPGAQRWNPRELRAMAADTAGEPVDVYTRARGTEQTVLWTLAGHVVAGMGAADQVIAPPAALPGFLDRVVSGHPLCVVLAPGLRSRVGEADWRAVRENLRGPSFAVLTADGMPALATALRDWLTAARADNLLPPVVALLGTTGAERARLAPVLSGLGDEDLVPVDAGECGRFVDDLAAATGPLRLAHRCRPVDFSGRACLRDLVHGRRVAQDIHRGGFWPRAVRRVAADTGDVTRTDDVRGGAGTGATAFAFLRAHSLAPKRTFHLDLETVDEPTAAEIEALVEWFDRTHPGGVLILDNCQLADGVATAPLRALDRRAGGRAHVIMVRTTPFSLTQQVAADASMAGDFLVNGERVWSWSKVRPDFAAWIRRRVGRWVESDDVLEADRSATSLWHFFWILRGGQAALDRDFAEAADRAAADVAWFAVAAHSVFRQRAGSVDDLHALLDELDLWPSAARAGTRRWLVAALRDLVAHSRVVLLGDRVACRHHLEARMVVRLSCGRDPRVPYLAAVRVLFRQALRPVTIPPALRPGTVDKVDIARFVRAELAPTLLRQSEVEQAVPWDAQLQDHVDQVWHPLVRLFETWPAHPLYWLVTRAQFADRVLLFNPFHRLRTIGALTSIESESDAVDVWALVKALVGYEAWQLVRRRLAVRIEAGAEFLPALRRAPATPSLAGLAAEYTRSPQSVVLDWGRGAAVDVVARDVLWYGHHAARIWLDDTGARFAALATSADVDRIAAGLALCTSDSARAITVAHLWLLNPDLGAAVFAAAPAGTRAALFDKFVVLADADPGQHTLLHLEPDDFALGALADALADGYPELRRWLDGPQSKGLGAHARLARTIAGGALPPAASS